MATWIAHLRVAEELLKHWQHLDRTAFAFGNLAPDSGVPNEDWTRFDPPKEVTHFLLQGQGEHQVRDLEFYRTYLQPQRIQDAFRLGYFVHLICDRTWSKLIGDAFKRDHADLIAQDEADAWRQVKDDWYGLDFLYVQQHPHSLFWEIANTDLPRYDLERIPKAAFEHQMHFIRGFYQTEPEQNLEREFSFLNEKTMQQYVETSVATVLSAFELLEQTKPEQDSILDSLPTLEPYSAPLGDVSAKSK
jgi:hypothetical protein